MNILAFIGASWYAWVAAIIVGIAVVAMVYIAKKPRYRDDEGGLSRLAQVVIFVVVFALAFGTLALINSYTTVQRGTVGLVSRFGALTGVVFSPGLHWKTPFIETVEIFDTTQQAYEMSNFPEESKATWTDFPVTSQTLDGQTVTITATTIFRIPDGDSAVSIRQNIGPLEEVVENVVKANTRSATRNLSKLFRSEQLYTGDILEYQTIVRKELERKFAEQGEGLVLADFLIRNTKFEEKYSDAVEAKQIAAENIVKQENDAKAAVFEAQRIKELATGEANAEIERAKGRAEAVRLEADANAYAIEQEGQALRRYEQILTLRFIENLNDKTLFLPSEAFQYLLPLEK
jgi:regulator of protease activity HflC (stomatin/prohibitin superfamily)